MTTFVHLALNSGMFLGAILALTQISSRPSSKFNSGKNLIFGLMSVVEEPRF
jgi:hypothetical protein